jgi:hypothetical protein
MKKKVICKEGYSIRTTKEIAKKVVREEGYLGRTRFARKNLVICEGRRLFDKDD